LETAFTPISASIGGALIGAAAVLLMASQGRIMGVSGIVARLLPPDAAPDRGWRLAFLAGALAAPAVYALAAGGLPAIALPAGLPVLVPAGLLVGFGTVMGSGCTSGHGVCGLARLSGRSLVATAVFMLTAAATVFAVRHVLAG
jgi:hypothetical protein